MVDIINHGDLAENRLATQFKEAANLIAYIRNLILESDNLEQTFHDLLNERWIDTAVGIQLDILGEIVGQPRILIDGDIFSYFGFLGNPSSSSFGTLLDPSIGGEFNVIGSPTSGNRVLTDDEYRIFIRARIIRNKSRSTPEDIISQIKFLYGTEQVILIDGDTEYSVSIGKLLNANDKVLLNAGLISKTVGVRVNYNTNYDFEDFFSFAGIPNGKGFGSVSDSSLGGKLGSLI